MVNRADFACRLGELTRHAYLLAFASTQVMETSTDQLSRELLPRLQKLCEDGREIDAADIRPEQICLVQSALPGVVADMLIVMLESEFHSFLMEQAGLGLQENARPLEELLAKLAPKEGRGRHEWAYKDAILMTEIRNSIVHGNGQVDRDHQRLKDIGWTRHELDREPCCDRRAFNDFLRFKRGVRNIANFVLE